MNLSIKFTSFFTLLMCVHLTRTTTTEDKSTANLAANQDSLVKNGQEQYELITSYSKLPKYGDCWKDAIRQLESGCKQLSDSVQTRLAIMFTYCLLKHLKFDLVECSHLAVNDENIDLNKCFDKLKSNSNAFNTFTEFFTHTQTICMFLENQVWNEQTFDLIKESKKTQHNLLNSVQQALESQKNLIETNKYLQDVINSSTSNVKIMFDEFQTQAQFQRQILFDVFDRLTHIQKYILGEFTLVYSFGFFFLNLFASYILTSTKRTNSARPYLWMFLISMLLTEWAIITLSKSVASNPQNGEDLQPYWIFNHNINDISDEIYDNIWMCRKFYIYLSLLTILICAYYYQDYNESNNKLLIEIKKEHLELKNLLNQLKTNVSINDINQKGVNCGESECKRISYYDEDTSSDLNSSCLSYSQSESSSTWSDDTLCSHRSDQTFVCDDNEEDAVNIDDDLSVNEDLSFMTAYGSSSNVNDYAIVKYQKNLYNLRPRRSLNYAQLNKFSNESENEFIDSIRNRRSLY